MERISISLDESLAEEFDRFLARHGYTNRSEAIRDLIRHRIEAHRLETALDGYAVGTLTYIFDHNERELASRLTRTQHRNHDLVISAFHFHLDHDNCLETVVLRGSTLRLREFADQVIARPGVRHGHFYLVPVDHSEGQHGHGGEPENVGHSHIRPQT